MPNVEKEEEKLDHSGLKASLDFKKAGSMTILAPGAILLVSYCF